MSRRIEECPHRQPAAAGGPDVADCRLLPRLTGIEGGDDCRVRRDLCTACCASLPPSETYLNPPIASKVYDIVGQALERGDLSEGERVRFGSLQTWAEESLAFGGIVLPVVSAATTRDETPLRVGGTAPGRVGLIGPNAHSGLGTLCRDLVRGFPVERWAMPEEPRPGDLPAGTRCRAIVPDGTDDVDAFSSGLDWILFFEQPWSMEILKRAREQHVRIACVPMWEFLDEQAPWLPYVDLMIAPTRWCRDLLPRWRERLGLSWDEADLPWPIGIDRFPFTRRETCRKFLFVNGHGGCREIDRVREPWNGRKGAAIVAEAARRAPEVPIIVVSQTGNLPPFPANVEVRVGDLDEASDLYREGDVCIQPSRWEGIGLPLLECQASGLPLLTTDAPPMNEHEPMRRLPCTQSRGRVWGLRSIPVNEVDADALARVLRELHGADISEASLAARRFVESHHSWTDAMPKLLAILDGRNVMRAS